MNTIKRDVYVLRNTIKIPIEVTKGTDMVGIEFTVRDFNIPVTAAAVAYSYNKKMKKPNSQLCDVSDNVISFAPRREFFEVGMNELQIRVINENKALISFKEKVKCSDAMGFPDDEEEKQQTLIEQLVSNSGKETGERKKADETERNERTAAIEKEKSERTQADATEKSERKAEIDVERKRIDNIAKLPEGSTAGDAELADIRVAADGTVYDTAGESVRGQINQIDKKYEKETGSLKEELNNYQMCKRWWAHDDNTFKNLSSNIQSTFMKITDFTVKTYLKDVSVYIYGCSVDSKGDFNLKIAYVYDGKENTFAWELPATEDAKTITTSANYGKCVIDISVTYSTRGNTSGTLLGDNQKIYVNVDYAGEKFGSEKIDNRIVNRVFTTDKVKKVEILRMQNCNTTITGSTYWYYNEYKLTYTDDSTETFIRKAIDKKTGIVKEYLNNDAIIYVDSDVLSIAKAMYSVPSTYELNASAAIRLQDISEAKNGINYHIFNNLIDDGMEEMINCHVYHEGTIDDSKYGTDGVSYRISVPDHKNIHLFFEYKWLDIVPYIDSNTTYTIAKVFDSVSIAKIYARKTSKTAGKLYRERLGAIDNAYVGTESAVMDCNIYETFNGENAFWIEYNGDTSDTEYAIIEFTENKIIIKNSKNQELIGSVTFEKTDSIQSLISKLNAIANIECGVIEVANRTCGELLPICISTTVNMKESYKTSSGDTIVGKCRLNIPYAYDNRWHTLEMVIDVDKLKTYCAFDGMTVVNNISTKGMYSNNKYVEVGCKKIRVRNLRFDYNSYGDAEVVQSIAPPYSGITQLISNHNPRLLIWEGHGIDVCSDADAPLSDDMATSTDRLNTVFAALIEKGYVPITWQDIIEWKYADKKLPKRCFNIMMDDYKIENYMDYEKRKPFMNYNVKAGLAVISDAHDINDTFEVDGKTITYGIAWNAIVRHGWYPCSHTYDHRILDRYNSSELDELFKKDAISCDEHGLYADIIVYPTGAFNGSTLTALERSGFKLGVNIVANRYNCRATSPYNLTRVEIGTRESLENVLAPIV